MNDKIKYKLEIEGLTLKFTILEMDERFRNNIKNASVCNSFISSVGNINILSNVSPSLAFFHTGSSVFLRGEDRDEDFRLCDITFDRTTDMMLFISDLETSLDDWAENWEGFKEPAEKSIESLREVEPIKPQSSLHALEIGGKLAPNTDEQYLRVPGGWVYGNQHGVCFIPYSVEFSGIQI